MLTAVLFQMVKKHSKTGHKSVLYRNGIWFWGPSFRIVNVRHLFKKILRNYLILMPESSPQLTKQIHSWTAFAGQKLNCQSVKNQGVLVWTCAQQLADQCSPEKVTRLVKTSFNLGWIS
jgi:hypothetical protein